MTNNTNAPKEPTVTNVTPVKELTIDEKLAIVRTEAASKKERAFPPEIKQQVLEICSLPRNEGGLTSEQASTVFGPCVNTINKWRREAKELDPLASSSKVLLGMALKEEDIRNIIVNRAIEELGIEFQTEIVKLYTDKMNIGLTA